MSRSLRSFSIRCVSEGGLVLTSTIEENAWDGIELLVGVLERSDSHLSDRRPYFAWKQGTKYLASAKETYGWREIIEEVKNNDLGKILPQTSQSSKLLAQSKPIMLRVAGEITNALIHSYDNSHEIEFFQNELVEPS